MPANTGSLFTMTEISAQLANSGPSASVATAGIITPAAPIAQSAAPKTSTPQTGFQQALASQIGASQPKLALAGINAAKTALPTNPAATPVPAASVTPSAAPDFPMTGNTQQATGNSLPTDGNPLPAVSDPTAPAPAPTPAKATKVTSSDDNNDDGDTSTPAQPLAVSLLAIPAVVSPAIADAGLGTSATNGAPEGVITNPNPATPATPSAVLQAANLGSGNLSATATPRSNASRAASLADALTLRNVASADTPTSANPAVVFRPIAASSNLAPATPGATIMPDTATSNPTSTPPPATAAPYATAAANHTQSTASDAATTSSSRHSSTILTNNGVGQSPANTTNQGPPNITTGTFGVAASNPGDEASALVDRLVEARAAAQGGSTAQSVQASVTHSEFGKVSLQFDRDPGGLSVSMTSADPGFAAAAKSALSNNALTSASAPSANAPSNNSQQVFAMGSSAGAGFGQSGGDASQSGQSGQQSPQQAGSSASSGFAGNGGQTASGQSGGQQGSSPRPGIIAAPAGTTETPLSPATPAGIFA